MIKTKKLLGLAVLVLSAGALVACGGGEEPADSEAASTAHKHKFVEDKTQSVPSTCTVKGKKVTVCECGEKKETETALAAHQYVEKAEEAVAATCDVDGKKVSYCSVCSAKKEETVTKLGHDFSKEGVDQTDAVAPTCTTKGTEKQKCTRCTATNDGEVDALGHDFVDDSDQSAAEQAACTFSGTVSQSCSRCTEKRTSTVTATGHEFAAQGEPTAAVADETGVVVGEGETAETYKGYTAVGLTKELCSKDNVTRLSWDAKQVTSRCKAPSVANVVTSGTGEDAVREDKLEPHITESDSGVQFWGRAIGNAQILDDTGSSSANSHVHEPDEHIEGSFMEYKIHLDAPLQSARLTANLIPANYLSRNDIWRAAGAENDWTPGYQKGVDGEMHIVNDWRYVMFIDDQQIQLDKTVDTKLINANSADWYSVPMRYMDFTAGDHTIKISMAGGYRHTFVNWGLETGVQHEHKYRLGEKAENSALRQVTCGCNKLAGYQLKAAEATSGQLNPSETGTDSAAKNTRLGKDNKMEDVWNITGISTGMYEVYLEARASANNSTNGKWKGDGTNVSDNGDTAELASEYKYKIAVGEAPAAPAEGEEAAADTRTWVGLGGEYSYASTGIGEAEPAWTNKALATIPVKAGETTLTIKNMNNGYSIWVYGVRLVKVSDFVY